MKDFRLRSNYRAEDDTAAHRQPAAKFELSVIMENTTSGLVGAIEYNTALFDAGTVARMARQFTCLLSALSAFPIFRLPHIRCWMLRRDLCCSTTGAVPRLCPSICMRAWRPLCQQVKRRPEATAVVFEAQTLSYLELDRQAEQLAGQLRRRGVGPEVLVGLCAERSPELVIALVAILKADGAYVALDPTYPPRQLGPHNARCQPALGADPGAASEAAAR